MSKSESYSENTQNVVESFIGLACPRNREFATVSTRQSCTWTLGVKEATITVVGEDASDTYTTLAVCFDAPSDIVADIWLTKGSSLTLDSQLVVIPSGQSKTFYFSGGGITRLDVKRLIGTDALAVFVEAA